MPSSLLRGVDLDNIEAVPGVACLLAAQARGGAGFGRAQNPSERVARLGAEQKSLERRVELAQAPTLRRYPVVREQLVIGFLSNRYWRTLIGNVQIVTWVQYFGGLVGCDSIQG